MTGAPTEPILDPVPQATGWRAVTPNALTVSRLVLTAGFVALLSLPTAEGETARPELLLAAAGLFVIAAVTDAADGYLARRWNAVSRFGRVMDPFADKLLVLGAFVLLAGPALTAADTEGRTFQASAVAPWMAVLILARELLVTSLRGLLEGQGVNFSATTSGKLKMILQSVAAPLLLILPATMDVEPGSLGRWLCIALAWATVIVTLLSGWPYLRRAMSVNNPPAEPGAPS